MHMCVSVRVCVLVYLLSVLLTASVYIVHACLFVCVYVSVRACVCVPHNVYINNIWSLL